MNKVVCIELGGNIQPQSYLPRAAQELRARFTVLKYSQVWETPPVGCEGCENFLNAALLIETSLDPSELKATFRQIEAQLDRVRTADKYAPRTIDIDTLIYDGDIVESEIWEYAHLAVPVAELMPQAKNRETGENLQKIAQRLLNEAEIKLRKDVELGA